MVCKKTSVTAGSGCPVLLLWRALLLMLIGLAGSQESWALAPVTAGDAEFLPVAEAFQFSSSERADGIELSWKIAPGYYLYRERFLFKASPPQAHLGDPEFSDPGVEKTDAYFGQVHVYHDQVSVFVPVNTFVPVDLKVSFQGCAEAGLCYPPVHKTVRFPAGGPGKPDIAVSAAKVTVPAQEAASGGAGSLASASGIFSFLQKSSIWWIFSVFFLLGIGLTFTPCVFPMIPIITSVIAGQRNPTTARSLLLSAAYVVGMSVTYASAGVATGLLGASANVQTWLQNPYVLSVFAALFVLLSLSMFGFYELQLPEKLRDRLNSKSQSISGGQLSSVLVLGALSALVVSPCVSAPLAGALVYISTTGDALVGGVSLLGLGLGMGVPLMLIAVGGARLLPRAGVWMEKVKQLFGVMLLAVAVSLVSRMLTDEQAVILWAVFLGLVSVGMGAFESAETGMQRVIKGVAVVTAFWAGVLFVGGLAGARSVFDPMQPFTSGASGIAEATARPGTQHLQFSVVRSSRELHQVVGELSRAGKPVLVDFYADWCISCKEIEHNIFTRPEVGARLARFGLVKADITENTRENQALLEEFGLFGPPSMLFFRQGKEIVSQRVVGEPEAGDLIHRLDRVLSM